MQVNGTTFPSWAVIPTIMFIFWLGGLSITVASIAKAQETHEAKPAHAASIEDVATIKANVAHNKAAIEEIKRKLEDQQRKAEQDKQEILEAIRDSE